MIAAMMVAALSANAQFEPGTFSIQPKAGMNIAKVSNMSAMGVGDYKLDRSLIAGGVIGAEAEYQIAKPFSVAAGLQFSMQGCQWKDDDFTVNGEKVEVRDSKVELNYITLPIVANLYLFKGFAIKTGVQFGFLVGANAKTTMKQGSYTLSYDEGVRGDCNKFDFSIPVGVSYQVPTIPIYIDGRAIFGLSDIAKDKLDNGTSSKNQVFQLTVGYKFAL